MKKKTINLDKKLFLQKKAIVRLTADGQHEIVGGQSEACAKTNFYSCTGLSTCGIACTAISCLTRTCL